MCKFIVIIYGLISYNAFSGIDYLPEIQRDYISYEDIGYTQYQTPSLYHSDTYSLTFDDGPHEINTPKILDILKKYNVTATFFIVTSRLNNKTIPIAIRAIKEGHHIGSHHHDHDHNNSISEQRFKSKLKESIIQIKNLYRLANTPLSHVYYRFPYAEYGKAKEYHHINSIREVSKELFSNNCIHFVFWDHDSSDWIKQLSASDIFRNLVSIANGGKYHTYKIIRTAGKKEIIPITISNYPTQFGGVILQHDIQRRTIQATDQFLAYSNKTNIRFAPLSSIEEYKKLEDSCTNAFSKKQN